MSKVYTGASVSLDGYISGPGESGFEHLFKWYGSGDVEVPTRHDDMTMRVTPENAEYLRLVGELTGALVVGRKLFDFTNGWSGIHPLGKPVVVLTHSVPDGWEREGEWFSFVTEGIDQAVAKAKELAGGDGVGVNGGQIARQCLQAGLLDEVWVDLVPVILGGGTPYFPSLEGAPYTLEGPETIIDAKDVTHLRYRVTRS
jgi:dihydrofolate reductase